MPAMTETTPAETSRRRARGGLAVLALLLALLALIVAAACAWRVWQWNNAASAQTAQTEALTARLSAAERTADAARAAQLNLQRQIDDVQNDLRAARDAQNALDQRTRNLETAIGQVSSQQFQSRDALLLDDAEFLLRAGQQRWSLFHDAEAAARAYALADDALSQVSDPAFAPVRSSIANEHAALIAAAAPSRQQALDQLAALRAQAANLPLAQAGNMSRKPDNGVFARAWHALSGILTIQRDTGASVPATDARIAREMLALDLAQAQASLLAFDDAGFRTAAQRAGALLATRFDNGAQEVRAAGSQLQAMLNARTAAPAPQLGGALAQLRALRAAHAAQSLITPVPAVSATKP